MPQSQPSRQEDISSTRPRRGTTRCASRRATGSGDFVVDVSGALAPADSAAPGLTLAELPAASNTRRRSCGAAPAPRLGDFPAVVARVLRDGQVVRRLAATPLLGQWSVTVSPALAPGDYTVEVEQGDGAGNVTRRSSAFTRGHVGAGCADDRPGELAAEQPDRESVGHGRGGAKVTIAEGVDKLADMTAGAEGAWAHALQQVADGTHTYTVTATDAAGNVSASAATT